MEDMILDAMKYVRRQQERNTKIILRRISKTSASNLNEDKLKIETNQMINKGTICKSYKY